MGNIHVRLDDVEKKIEFLQNNFQVVQDSLANNITWFIMLLTLVVAVLIVCIVF